MSLELGARAPPKLEAPEERAERRRVARARRRRAELEVPVERAERRHRVGHGRVGRDDVAALVARRADVELAPLPLVVFGTEGVDGPTHGVGHTIFLSFLSGLRKYVAARRARADRQDCGSRPT